jgi:hypothetical protein
LLGILKLHGGTCKPEGILSVLGVEFRDDSIDPASFVRGDGELVGHVVALGW